MKLCTESFESVLDRWVDLKSEHWETSAYIKSTLRKYLKGEKDLSDKSVVLLWFDAKQKHNFQLFQDIGDWVFFTRVMFPESIPCDISFYSGIGRASYYRCYKRLNGAWPLYEELADNFDYFVDQVSTGKDFI